MYNKKSILTVIVGFAVVFGIISFIQFTTSTINMSISPIHVSGTSIYIPSPEYKKNVFIYYYFSIGLVFLCMITLISVFSNPNKITKFISLLFFIVTSVSLIIFIVISFNNIDARIAISSNKNEIRYLQLYDYQIHEAFANYCVTMISCLLISNLGFIFLNNNND